MDIYHYTEVQTLLSIIENSELWLTNSNSLNDNDEMKHYIQLVIDAIRNTNPQIEIDDFVNKLETTLNEMLDNVYVFSLSSNPDVFNLWSYFSKSSGCNICIDADKILYDLGFKPIPQTPIAVKQISAFINVKENIIITNKEVSKLNDNCVEVMHGKVEYNDYLKNDYITQNLPSIIKEEFNVNSEKSALIEMLLYNALFFKKKGFEAENEYRIVIKIRNDYKEKQKVPFFRVLNNLISSYIKIRFAPEKYIKSITVGPDENKQNIAKSIRKYLFLNGLKNIEVKESKLNIRKR